MKKPNININNFMYKVVAAVLAILFWLYVSHQENPVVEQIITVPLEVRGLSQNLVVADLPDFVKVRVQGQRKVLETVTSRDVYAFLELSGLDVGQHVTEVYVTLPEKTQLVSVIPSSINIKIEVMTTTQLPVNVSYSDNTPAQGYLTLEPVLSPAQVLVSGPDDRLRNVGQVYVEVNLGDINHNFHQTLPVKVEDKEGNLIQEWITVSPPEVDVLVPVVHQLPSKTVPVKIPLTGSPQSGYLVERVVAEPEVLTIYGEMSQLDQIDTLTTTAVNIDQAAEDVVDKVNVILPKGITIDRNSPLMAVVKIAKLVQKSFEGLPITMRNLSPEQEQGLDVGTARVVVEGPESVIEKLLAADIQVYADLDGLGPGEHKVPVQADIPVTISLVEIEPEEITINLP